MLIRNDKNTKKMTVFIGLVAAFKYAYKNIEANKKHWLKFTNLHKNVKSLKSPKNFITEQIQQKNYKSEIKWPGALQKTNGNT